MLTDLGSNCFGDANIGPLCFCPFVRGFYYLGSRCSWKKIILTQKKGVWVLLRYVSLLPLCSKLTSLHARSHSKTPKVVIVRSERRNHGRLFVVMSR
jgi:hypothetical protein